MTKAVYKRKHLIEGLLTVSEGESFWGVLLGSQEHACRWADAAELRAYTQILRQQTGKELTLETSKPTPSDISSDITISPKPS